MGTAASHRKLLGFRVRLVYRHSFPAFPGRAIGFNQTDRQGAEVCGFAPQASKRYFQAGG